MEESNQIELIAEDYRSRGYKVMIAEFVPLEGLEDFQADLIARRPQDNVVIEIANLSNRVANDLRSRARQLANVLQDYPDWRLEFRFVEATPEQFRHRLAAVKIDDVLKMFNRPLIRRTTEDPDRTTQYAMADWWLWTRGIRALAADASDLRHTSDLADLVEDLTARGILKDRSDTNRHDTQRIGVMPYLDVHNAMLAAMEGQRISDNVANNLRTYVTDLRTTLRSRGRSLGFLD